MTKKSDQSQLKKPKGLAPVKKLTPGKKGSENQSSKKESEQKEMDDWNSPVFIDSKKSKEPLYERPLMNPPEEDQAAKPDRPSTDIKKAKIKNELFLEVEYTEMIKDGTNTVKKDCTAPIHNDLKNAFKKLDAHLTGISEQYKEDGTLDMQNITCKGFSIGGDGEGVKLFGFRKLSNGKALNFLSPFTKWDDETVEYDAGDLRAAINKCKSEVIKYLFEGKHQPDVQGKLDL